MKPACFTLFSLFIAGMLLAVSCDKSPVHDEEVPMGELPDPIRIELRSEEKKMIGSDQAFAFEFFENVYREEAEDEDANFMVSPLSLSMALMMTSNGAAGETKLAMRTTLHLDGYGDEEVNAYYKKLKEALLKTDPSTKLSIANAIFTNQLVNIHEAFIQTNQSYFDATIQKVNFGDPATVGIINGWASEHTNGLIKKVIERTQSLDLMYLLNAIYFKGIWTTQFDKKNTSRKPFTNLDGGRANVDMMHQTANFNYTEDRTFQLIQLPYGNQAFSMMVLLPLEGISLGEAVTVLNGDGYWGGLQSRLSDTEVVLSLPKFKTEYSKKLNDVLTTMGMGVAFSNMADFSGMSDYSAKISFVKQDTYISTDEEGTEAAAVTTVGVEVTALPSPRKVIFNANRPFLYLIQENSTGAILFMGAVKHFK
ncbi:MAG TPA: serpin family protein [Bacteroidales bacterium]|jgi:serpin B|nr:serpin family protein [Bacteroidales bacterium]